jgi:hypothetical protein
MERCVHQLKNVLKNPKKIVHNFNENGEYNNEWDYL